MKLYAFIPRFAAGLLMFIPLVAATAQGTFQRTVMFDGPPIIQPTDSIGVKFYTEDGMSFTSIVPNGQFGRSGGAEALETFPRNGTAYIYTAFRESLAVTRNNFRFGLFSVDLAEFSTLYQTPLTVQFVGYRPDGSTVTTELVTDGIIDGAGPLNDFQTFYFDSRFADLVRVEVPSYGWSLDNMVFSNVVPEPGAGVLVVLGAALSGFRFVRESRQHDIRIELHSSKPGPLWNAQSVGLLHGWSI